MTPIYWKQAQQELAVQDKIMRRLIQQAGNTALSSRGDAFTTLARSIVGQQISVKAAESVWQKVIKETPEITAQALHNSNENSLRACGLSQRKVSYLQDLSRHFIDETWDEAAWNEMDDEALIAQLIQVKGIGRWTAEMFLIFHMLRPNVLPLDDIGLQRAISLHYNTNQPLDKKTIREIANQWQPWCSVATWYLWRSLDPLPVAY
ncbi:MAG: DNA-3-methyladenine glycosylase 2 family protein [Nitrosomonas sp.]|nr:DNA-3-methyladenine glycosylase 2 family protein [Nitrosomonas sp.]